MDNTEQKNIQNIMAYLIEINLLSQYLLKIRLLNAADSKNKAESAESQIERINKAWTNISLVQALSQSETKNNLLDDIKIAKQEISEDLKNKDKFDSENETEINMIFTALSNQKKRLAVLEQYVLK